MKQRSKAVRPSDEQLHFGRIVADEFQRGFGFVREQGQIRGEIFAHISILGWQPALNEWMVYSIGPNPKNHEQNQVAWANKPLEETDWLRRHLLKFDELSLTALLQLNIITEREIIIILTGRLDKIRTATTLQYGMQFLSKVQIQYPNQFEFVFINLLSSAGFAEKLTMWNAYGSVDNISRYTAALGSSILLNLWLAGRIYYYSFNDYGALIFTLDPSEQLLFLRKTFKLIADETIQITAEQLDTIVRYSRAEIGSDNITDYSVDLAISVLATLAKGGPIPDEQTIAEVVCRYIDENTVTLGRFGQGLFAPCLGRADKDRKPASDRNSVIARIAGVEYPASSDRKTVIVGDKKLLVSNNEVEIEGELLSISWIVTLSYDYQPGENKLQYKPAGIDFCEGRKADVIDNDSQLPIWWCCNYPCFKPNQRKTSAVNWQKFTLIDFISILNLPFDINEYYAFIGLLNRVNRLLAHLECRCCKHILRPIGQSNFNFYRTTRFSCTNQQCTENGKEVYLSHCLNGHCMTVIDSRDSKRCRYTTEGFPDRQGMYICQVCGGCCSKEALQRRKKILDRTHTPEALLQHYQYGAIKFNLDRRLYHWERQRIFCYKCAKPMVEFPSYYQCSGNCETRYNRSLSHIEFARKKNLVEVEPIDPSL